MNRNSSSSTTNNVRSEEARARARIADSKIKMGANRRNSRRLSIQGSLAFILGDENTEDFGIDDSIRSGSVSSQKIGKSCHESSSRTSRARYQRRGSVTKYSLDDTNNTSTSILSAEARARARVADSRNKMGASRRNSRRLSIQGSMRCILGDDDTQDLNIDDDMRDYASRQSGKSCQSSRTAGMRYQRRGSVTKYSVDASLVPVDALAHHLARSITTTDDDSMKNHRPHQHNGNTTHSRDSSSSFADAAPLCATIDSLPLPMKKKSSAKINKGGSKKAGDPINKCSHQSAKQDAFANGDDAREFFSERKTKVEEKSTTAAENKQPIANDSDLPLKKKTKQKKKKKKELNLRRGQKQRASTTSINGATKKRIKQKRRCSVTKYNLVAP